MRPPSDDRTGPPSEPSQQRDALVREVHHRIKNHLHGITNLIRNRLVDHPELAPLLHEVIAQIDTIATVYGLQGGSDHGRVLLAEMCRAVAGSVSGPLPIVCDVRLEGHDVLVTDPDPVTVALVVNELATNACKHVARPDPTRPVRLSLAAELGTARVTIANGPASLPTGFSLAERRGLGNGLDIVSALLPTRGSSLAISQRGDEVVAELVLAPPVIRLVTP